MIAKGCPPDGDDRGAEVEGLGGDQADQALNVSTVAARPDNVPLVHCEYAGVYCATFTVEQLVALGRIGACCRHYIDSEEVST